MSRGVEVIEGVVPSKSNCYTVARNKQGRYFLAKSDEVRRYERSFAKQCKVYKGAGISQQFTITLAVYYPDYTHDLDNSLKAVLDCLQQVGAITNDNLCTRIEATRHHDTHRPRIEFEIIVHNEQTALFDL